MASCTLTIPNVPPSRRAARREEQALDVVAQELRLLLPEHGADFERQGVWHLAATFFGADDRIDAVVSHDERFVGDMPAVLVKVMTQLVLAIHRLQDERMELLDDERCSFEDVGHQRAAHARDAGRLHLAGREHRKAVALPHLDLLFQVLLAHRAPRSLAGAEVQVARNDVLGPPLFDECGREIAVIRADVRDGAALGHEVQHGLESGIEFHDGSPSQKNVS